MINRLPDWSGGFIESYQWRTSVQLARGGAAESRQAIGAGIPVRSFSSGQHFTPADDLIIHSEGSEFLFAFLPGASRFSVVDSSIVLLDGFDVSSKAAVALGFDTRAVISVAVDGEVTEHQDVTASSGLLLFAAPHGLDGTEVVYPAFKVRASSPIALQRAMSRLDVAQTEWAQVESARLFDDPLDLGSDDLFSDSFLPTSTASEEVEFFFGPSSETSSAVARRVRAWDPGVGARDFFDIDLITRESFSRRYACFGAFERLALVRFLFRRRGRFDPCFVATGRTLEFIRIEESSSVFFPIVVEDGWTSEVPDARRAVLLTYPDGTRAAHMLSNVLDSSEEGEAILVAEKSDFGSADPESIEWLTWARLSSDSIAIEHASSRAAACTLSWTPLEHPEAWP